MQTLNKNEGLITQIIGPVIDVEFAQDNLPEIYNALKQENIHICFSQKGINSETYSQLYL